MPRHSFKQKLYKYHEKRYLVQKMMTKQHIDIIEHLATINDDKEDDEDFADYVDFLRIQLKNDFDRQMMKHIKSNRYIVSRKHDKSKPASRGKRLKYLLEQMDSETFVQEMRMDRDSFDALFKILRDHPVYQSTYQNPQTDIRLQMAVVLERLGLNNNDGSSKQLAKKYGVSNGSVDVFTSRFFQVLLSLEKKYVYWPNAEEKEQIKTENQSYLGFPDCLGFMDGTQIYFGNPPKYERHEFETEPGQYSMQVMAICDHKRRFRYLETGHFGSSNDMQVLNESLFKKEIDRYFDDNEYVLGDNHYNSRYPFLVPVSKGSEDNRRFDHYILQMQIKIEHAIDMLKTRFPSLHKLRLLIRVKEDIRYASGWVRVCATLNNFLISRKEDSLTVLLEKQYDEKEKLVRARLEEAMCTPPDDKRENTSLWNKEDAGKTKYDTIKSIVLDEMKRRST